MNADAYFEIGKTHLVCEDYALADSSVSSTYAIVADGCSSTPDTDFGSRLLVLSARMELSESALHPDMTRIGQRATENIPKLGLSPQCLDSTLLLAYPTEDNIRVIALGDGVILARRRNGQIESWDIDFNESAPGYLSYLLTPSRMEVYLQAGLGLRTVYDSRTGLGERDQLTKRTFEYIKVFPKSEYDMVMLVSDGIHSFQRRTENSFASVPMEEVIPHLVGIHGFTGQFLVRRLRRFLHKECLEMGWHHYDDLSVAALYWGDEE